MTFKKLIQSLIVTPTLVIALQAPLSFAGPVANLTISPQGEELAFDKKELVVKAGQKVKLTLKNISSMQHNWVLVIAGAADEVASASIAAGNDKGWLAEGPNVLAHTKLVDGKSSDTIEFTAPAQPGDYPYLCTFPGHSTTMKGILKVKK